MVKGKYHWTLSEETKNKISDAKKGEKNPNYGKHRSEETKNKISKILKGRHLSKEIRRKISETTKGKSKFWLKGKHRSKETKRKMAEAHRKKDAITPITKLIRESARYSQWRQQCFIRDNFTCQRCNQHGGELIVHHKRSFSKLVKEAKSYMPLFPLYDACMFYVPMWDINNGITLCRKCHEKKKWRRGKYGTNNKTNH